ncbi:MAG: SDR family oxidoreductase [Planctomycetota bacterium]|jgi:long-chain acyl-CoA synthetase
MSHPTAVYWRVEGPGNLLPADLARQAGFLARNARGIGERVRRCAAFALAGCAMPFLQAIRPDLGTRILHSSMRGLSRDRLDFLGEEYFARELVKRLVAGRVARLRRQVEHGLPVVLVSGWLDLVVRPLARHLGVDHILCNRLEFRYGRATGRLLDPIVPSRGVPRHLEPFILPAVPPPRDDGRSLVIFEDRRRVEKLSVRETLRGREILLIGVTGFIGKVWLTNLLKVLPEIGKVYCLIRPKGPLSAKARFERVVAESPVLRTIEPEVLTTRIEVVEGDMRRRGLGLDDATRRHLQRSVDLIVNSGGLTEFNPDLRAALAANVDSTIHAVNFLRECERAALMHLSTCYVAGQRDGRIHEEIEPNYNPKRIPGFDAGLELQELQRLIGEMERAAQQRDLIPPVRPKSGRVMSDTQMRKARQRWLRNELSVLGTERAQRYGWPNTYTFTKSLAESLLAKLGADLPIAVVRPSVVETSTDDPFPGWNEGVTTSAPISYLLGTLFRLLPTHKRLRLDVIPVDLATRGMNLIAAALVRRVHLACYQLATSTSNPCDMARITELTQLAHRKHYRDRPGLQAWLRTRSETVPVSRRHYRTFSAPGQRRLVKTLRKVLPFARMPLKRMERSLERVEKIIELYEPFIHDNDYAFEADHVRLLNAALLPQERETFGYDDSWIDWSKYWIDVHIPALRKWTYPLIEGRPVEV